MESLGEILKRTQTPAGHGKKDTPASLESEPSGEKAPPTCPICGGDGWVMSKAPLGHPDFGKAFPCQCTLVEFEREYLSRMQRYSNLGPLTRLTFDNLIPQGRSSNPDNQKLFDQAYQAARAFAQKPEGWLVLTGASGCGKTHLAAAIANECVKEGRLAFFIVVPDLLDHLRSTFSPEREISYDELFEQVRNAPLLILDDLGTQSRTPWAEEKLFQILNYRFNARLPTVITTNIAIEDFEERLQTRLTDPTLSRVFVVEKSHMPVLDALDSLDLPLQRGMTFERFDVRGMNLVGEQRENLERAFRVARSYAEAPDGWLVFIGKHGVGKTHLAAAIAHYRKAKSEEARLIEVPPLLDYLRRTFAPESKIAYDVVFEKVRTLPLLILDDYGEQASTPWAAEKLYQIINYRYNTKLPTVITTSSSEEEIEERIRSRMLDPRISIVFHITAPDYRSGAPSHTLPRQGFPRGRRPSTNSGNR